MSNTSSFRIDADTSAYEEAMQRAVASTTEAVAAIREHFESVNSTFESMRGVFEAAVAVLSGGEIAEKLNEMAERAEGMREAAQVFDISTRALQGLQVMAAQSGVSSDQLAKNMGRLEERMRTAGEQGGIAAKQFNALGITTEQLRDPLFTVEDAMVRMGDATNSNAQLLAVLGVRAAPLIPMIRELADNHGSLSEAMRTVGGLTDDEINTLSVYHGQIQIASAAWDNFKSRVMLGVVPAMETVLGQMAAYDSSADNAVAASNSIKASLDAVGTAFYRVVESGRVLVDILIGVGRIGIDAFEGVGNAIGAVGSILSSVAKAVMDFESGHTSKIGEDLKSGFKQAEVALAGSASNIKADFDNMVAYIGDDSKEATQKIQAMQDALSGNPIKPPAAPAVSTALLPDLTKPAETIEQMLDKTFEKISEEAQAQMNKAWGQIANDAAASAKSQEASQSGAIDRQIAAVQELGRTHKLSATQELSQEIGLLNDKWSAQQAYYEKLKTIYQNNTAKLDEVNSQEDAAWQKHLNEMLKAQDQATTALAQQWQKVGDKVASSFSSAIDGMLTKNRTFTQSVLQLGQSLVTGLINNFVKMGVAWAEQEIMKMIASRTAAAGVVSASAGAAGAAGTASFAAAPWPVDLGAAAFGASMAAVAGSFAVAEKGYDIPAGVNPMVQAHAREMILPAKEADAVRDMADGGGRGGAQVHIHATDAQSVERLANNHSSAFHQALKKYYGRGGR